MWWYECGSLWTRTARLSSMLLIYTSAPTHRMRYHYWVTNSRALGERTHRIYNILWRSHAAHFMLEAKTCLVQTISSWRLVLLRHLDAMVLGLSMTDATHWRYTIDVPTVHVVIDRTDCTRRLYVIKYDVWHDDMTCMTGMTHMTFMTHMSSVISLTCPYNVFCNDFRHWDVS